MIGSPLRQTPEPLSLEETLYPVGFPLRISTNSELVLRAARTEWGDWRPAGAERTVSLDIQVSPGGHAPVEAPGPAEFHAHRHLFALVADASAFAVCDTRARTGFARVTIPVVKDAAYFQYHFLDPMVYVFIESLYLTPIHAACVA